MIMMQYKVKLPNDFDMNNIRKRVQENGFKTDGFEDLFFKAYLISEKNKEYSPLYFWKDNKGMNKFIFDGFYDNILNSFGWQTINIGIPLLQEFDENFSKAKYLLEIENETKPMEKMKRMEFSISDDKIVGKALVYNPENWKHTEYYLFEDAPKEVENSKVYEVLHISQ